MSLRYAIRTPVVFYPVTLDESGDPTFGDPDSDSKCRFEGRSVRVVKDGELLSGDGRAFILARADALPDVGNRADILGKNYRILTREPYLDPLEGPKFEVLIVQKWEIPA